MGVTLRPEYCAQAAEKKRAVAANWKRIFGVSSYLKFVQKRRRVFQRRLETMYEPTMARGGGKGGDIVDVVVVENELIAFRTTTSWLATQTSTKMSIRSHAPCCSLCSSLSKPNEKKNDSTTTSSHRTSLDLLPSCSPCTAKKSAWCRDGPLMFWRL